MILIVIVCVVLIIPGAKDDTHTLHTLLAVPVFIVAHLAPDRWPHP